MKNVLLFFLFGVLFFSGAPVTVAPSTILTNCSPENVPPGSYKPSKSDCKKFWICAVNGVWEAYDCPLGLEFDESTDTCKIPSTFSHTCGCNSTLD